MNYIELINQFWKTRRSKRITNLQADLYFYLLNESNSRDWENPFQCPNGLICSAISVSEKALIDARNVLQQIGLIKFEKGVTKQKAPVYYLLKVSIPVSKPVSIPVSNKGSDPPVIDGTLIHKPKRKPNKEDKIFIEFEFLEFKNIKIQPVEFEKLCKEYTQDIVEKAILYLSNYKIEKNYKTKSDYLTIRRWVIDAVKKSKNNLYDGSRKNTNTSTGSQRAKTVGGFSESAVAEFFGIEGEFDQAGG